MTADKPIPPVRATILWVGNSYFFYNTGIHHHVRELCRAAGHAADYRGCQVTISGSGLDWHEMESYFRPNGIGSYSFVDNEVVFNDPPLKYDTVVMMDSSQGPVHPRLRASFHDTVGRYCKTVRANSAQPILFMSWAYKHKPEMIGVLAEQYNVAGRDNGVKVIPAGLAFARISESHPAIDLHQPDNSHPSLAGTYLAACTAYATIFGRSTILSSYGAGLDPAVRDALQRTAQETVKSYKQQDTP
jgi:hypothetical protein